MEQLPPGKNNRKIIGVPFKSKKNLGAGMFRADSLGDAVAETEGKKVDMEIAKQGIRHHREILSGEFQRKEEEKLKETARTVKVKNWWRNRKDWESVKVGDRIGKANPRYANQSYKHVEFVDGTTQWVTVKS